MKRNPHIIVQQQGVVEDTEIEINLASPKGGMPPITFNKEFSLKEGKN